MGVGVRVRFAPSPTGHLHLGGARTALFNFLFARANRGSVVLRIEDTDKERYVPGSVEKLEETLKWLGIQFDEGPSIGGKFAPYFQSERLHLYQSQARELISRGSAYPCFCSRERLHGLRSTHLGYDGRCRRLSERQAEENIRMGLDYTVRLKVPEEGHTVVSDLVYGDMKVKHITIDDQVLLKSDGYPTYHLASVVDDHLMEISHVMRGEEWLLSTAKHLLIYSALKWQPPEFVHLPLLLSSSGAKLSKRNNDTFAETYRERGYLPEAVVNFIALLGWSPHGSGETSSTPAHFNPQELFSLDELVEQFSLEGLNKRPVMVGKKLTWMNKQHFKRKLNSEEGLQQLAARLQEQLTQQHGHLYSCSTGEERMGVDHLKKVLLLLEDRVSLLPQIPQQASYFWIDPALSSDTFAPVNINDKGGCLAATAEMLSRCDFKSRESLDASLRSLSAKLDVSYRSLMLLCRLAITGVKSSPGLSGVMMLLGREAIVKRLHTASQLL